MPAKTKISSTVDALRKIGKMNWSFRLIGVGLGPFLLYVLVQTGAFSEVTTIAQVGSALVFGGLGWIADAFITISPSPSQSE